MMIMQFIILTSVFVWAGCVIAISFMESWLKFRAPGVTVPIGLSIGKLVFSALNKLEWLFAAIILVGYLLNMPDLGTSIIVWYSVALLFLMVQTFWLLPALNARANVVISGKSLTSSSLHLYFVLAEFIKLGSLFVLGFQLFKGFVVG